MGNEKLYKATMNVSGAEIAGTIQILFPPNSRELKIKLR